MLRERLSFWLAEAIRTCGLQPGREATSLAVMAATLESLGYDPTQLLLLPSEEAVESLLRKGVSVQLEHYRRALAGRNVIVFWVFHNYVANTQQLELARNLLRDGRYPVVFLVTNRWRSLDEFHLNDLFCQHQPLYIPDHSLIQTIDFASVFWSIDCLYDIPLPPGAVRLLQPHGTDILFDYSLEFYGAGLLFDFLLSPSFSEDVFRKNYQEHYDGLIPRCLADHASPRLNAIETGSFKLDHFARRCRENTPTDIIYNLSSWDLEHPEVKRGLTSVLKEILARHPNRRLVFRCYPGDEDAVRPHIATLLEEPRFFWSTAPNYIEDYANGVVLIHHRGSTAEIFSVAAGRPSIKLDYFKPHAPQRVETPVGCIVHDQAQLWAALEEHVCLDTAKTQEIVAYRQKKYPNFGRALDLVLEGIPKMLSGQADPAWRSLPLAPTPEGQSDREFVRSVLIKLVRRDILIPILAERAVRLLPDSALARFYAVKSIITHVYSDLAFEEDPWLIAAEHLAEFHRLQGQSDIPEEFQPRIREWTTRFLPARLIGLMGWSVHYHNVEQRQRLDRALRAAPLLFFETDGIPQRMEESMRQEDRRRDRLNELTRAKQRYLPSPLFFDELKGAQASSVFLGDPFLSCRARWDDHLAPLAKAPAVAWRRIAPESLEHLNTEIRSEADELTSYLCAKLDAVHPGGPRGQRFWVKALGMGIQEVAHLLWQIFDLFEAGLAPDRHDVTLLDSAGYHVPLDFDDLRWFLQHSDFGMEQAFSTYVRNLHPELPCRSRMARYDNPYRVRSVGEPTAHNPIVGILGSFPAEPYMQALVQGSNGRIQQIGFRRELNLYGTLADTADRLDLCAEFSPQGRFGRFLKACLPWMLPKSMLENFIAIERSIENDFAAHSRMTHVVSEFWIGESYECMALAVLSKRGVKHVYNEHVLSRAPLAPSTMGDLLDICDIYAGCSAFEMHNVEKYIPTGSLFDFCATIPQAKEKRKCTYFSAKPFARSMEHSAQEISAGYSHWAPDYYTFKQALFSDLPSQLKESIVYRRYPYDDFFKFATLFWHDESMMDGFLNECTLDDHALGAREAIRSSEIVIIDQLSTTFIESTSLGTPTVLLLFNSGIFSPRFAPAMEKLKRCGIIQDNPETAAAFLKSIWADPSLWWNSDEVRAARQCVLDLFMGRPQRMIDMLLDLAGRESEPAPKPGAKSLESFLCPNPFLYAELRDNGDVVPCCYLGMTFGNIHEASLAEIWNSPQARQLRASMLDGSYRYCDAARCAGMQKALRGAGTPGQARPEPYQIPYELLHRGQLDGSALAWITGRSPESPALAPTIISLEDDPSCNLSCPSCRTAPMAIAREESARLEKVHSQLLEQLNSSGGEMWLCGAGDPFASRVYRKLLLEFDPAALPGVRFRIDTNGVLLTPDLWEQTLGRYPERISLLAVSVDAVDEKTYSRLRRGGDWNQLRRNLEFLGGMRLKHPGMHFILRMIVQRENFRQMPAFAAMARGFNADRAVFSALENWGSFDSRSWEAQAVHLPGHMLHEELLSVLRDPLLGAPDVDLGNLTALLRS